MAEYDNLLARAGREIHAEWHSLSPETGYEVIAALRALQTENTELREATNWYRAHSTTHPYPRPAILSSYPLGEGQTQPQVDTDAARWAISKHNPEGQTQQGDER